MGVLRSFAYSRVRRSCRGTTLIEALVFLFVFSVITVTFYSTWSLGTRFIILAKNRMVASALATEKMEVIRNLAFEDIAHTTGVPAGNLLQDESVVRSGGTYQVHTQIVNRDDDFDGTLSDTDVDFIDFKDVKITVSWGSAGQSVSVSSRFVPAGIEQSAAGMGILVVNVTSDKNGGALVSGATVRVQNTALGYDETNTTDSMGRLMLVGIPEGIQEYMITVSKSDYETVSTLAPYPTTAFNPTHEHASVVELSINTANIYQNELANLRVETKDFLGADAPNVEYHLFGGKKIGTDATDPTISIYDQAQSDPNDVTDGSGENDYGDVSPGPYFFRLMESNTMLIGLDRTSTRPLSPLENYWEFSLDPDESVVLSVSVSPDVTTGTLFVVTNDADGKPIPNASVHLTNASPFDDTDTTDAIGYSFFPRDATPFVAGTYDYTVSVAGFTDVTGQVTVSGGAIEIESISMTAN